MKKIDLIVDALEELMHSNSTDIAAEKFSKALAAARELQALKPVAWWDCKPSNGIGISKTKDCDDWQPLYTLDEVLK
jgi:hypothetical protein